MSDLSRRYRGPLERYFRARLGSAVDVDDLVQEVFLRLTQRGPGAPVAAVENYLFTVAASVLNDTHRRAARRGGRHQPFDDVRHSGEDFSPERVFLGREQLAAVEMALHELPERTRGIFVLNRFEEMTYREIARRLQISTSAVEKHMIKALAHLARRRREL